jgi:hypothetical protein
LTGELDEFTENGKPQDPNEKKEIVENLKEQIYIFKGQESFRV